MAGKICGWTRKASCLPVLNIRRDGGKHNGRARYEPNAAVVLFKNLFSVAAMPALPLPQGAAGVAATP